MSESTHLITQLLIDAPVATVWRVLTDFDAYPEWNPGLSFRDTPVEGATVRLAVKLLGPSFTTPVTIEAIEPERMLRWRGGPALLMSGTHYFELRPEGPNRTELIHGEQFSGLALPLLWPLLRGRLNAFYWRINTALKLRAEQAAGQQW
jgi:hypothetical protein